MNIQWIMHSRSEYMILHIVILKSDFGIETLNETAKSLYYFEKEEFKYWNNGYSNLANMEIVNIC